jgi:hypothetical protein
MKAVELSIVSVIDPLMVKADVLASGRPILKKSAEEATSIVGEEPKLAELLI